MSPSSAHCAREPCRVSWWVDVCSVIRQASVGFSVQPCRIKGDIGQPDDGDSAPLTHCVRLLAASFLLTGERNGKGGGRCGDGSPGFRPGRPVGPGGERGW